MRYPGHVDWKGNPAEFVIGIAGVGDEHLALLGKIATIFVDADRVAELRTASTADEVVAIINSTPD